MLSKSCFYFMNRRPTFEAQDWHRWRHSLFVCPSHLSPPDHLFHCHPLLRYPGEKLPHDLCKCVIGFTAMWLEHANGRRALTSARASRSMHPYFACCLALLTLSLASTRYHMPSYPVSRDLPISSFQQTPSNCLSSWSFLGGILALRFLYRS